MRGLWQKMEHDRALTPEFRACIERVYGERGRKALEAVDAGQVKRYLDFFVVVGQRRVHRRRDFCTCSDFSRGANAGTFLRCSSPKDGDI